MCKNPHGRILKVELNKERHLSIVPESFLYTYSKKKIKKVLPIYIYMNLIIRI